MQVYRGMDVGTAKPNLIERRGVAHHMIDLVDPSEEYTVAEFRRAGREVIEAAECPLIVTVGSGLHFRSLVDPMSFAPTDARVRADLEASAHAELIAELTGADPTAVLHVDLANRRRVVRAVEILRLTGETPTSRAETAEAQDLRRYKPELEFTAIGVDPGDLVEGRIDVRLGQMREGGLVEEVRGLQGRMGRTARSAVGYKEILSYLRGEVTEEQAFDETRRNSRRLAGKQRTWFQRDPRIRWIPWIDDAGHRIERALEALE